MPEWKNDTDLFDVMRKKLYTAVVGDIMDTTEYTNQFLPPSIKPLKDHMVVVGRAMTVLEADCFSKELVYEKETKPFGLMFEALDDLKNNEVYICTGSSPSYALWGELMSTRAAILGSAGAVLNGYSRDTRGILEMDFPTFSMGSYAKDQGIRGRVIDFRCPIRFQNNVLVRPGDIVFGDIDGVLIIPQDIETEVVEKALEKVRGENKVREEIKNGMSTVEAWNKYKVM